MTPARLQQYVARLRLPPRLTVEAPRASILAGLAEAVRSFHVEDGSAPGRIVGTADWLAAIAQETWPGVCRLAQSLGHPAPTLDDHIAHTQAQAAKGHLILFGLRVWLHQGSEDEPARSTDAITRQGEGGATPGPDGAGP